MQIRQSNWVRLHESEMDLGSRGLDVQSFLLLLFFQLIEWNLSIFVLDELVVDGTNHIEHVRLPALHIDPARTHLRWRKQFRQISLLRDCQLFVRFEVWHYLSSVGAKRRLQIPVQLADEARKAFFLLTKGEELVLQEDGFQVSKHLS